MKEAWLSSCRAKIARADAHLATLYRETDGWGNGDPFVVTRERYRDGREHVFSLRFKTQPDVWLWAGLLGDALFNLRCALDHIVYALAMAETGKNPPDDDAVLVFPIVSESKFFKNQRFRIASLSDPTQAAIEKAQPYNRLKPGQWFAPLWVLAQLNDIDKHRSSHIAVTHAHHDEIAIDATPGTFQALWNEGPLIDGAPVLRVILTEPNPDVHVDLKATAAVVLKNEEIPPISVCWTTKRIRNEVVLICRYLSGFFPESQPTLEPSPSKG